MRRASAALLALLAAAGARPAAAAPPPSPYAPSPAGFASLVGTREEEDLAARAIAAVDALSPEEARRARDDLLCAGPAGTRAAAAALAAAEPSPAAEVRLLQVLAASRWPEVDAVLARAAARPRFEVRALAAQALGAGRTAAAVETLAPLARDAVPAVRGTAVRALFAIESPAARAARIALPAGDAETLTLRLRLHRLRGDEDPALFALALETWEASRSPAARVEAARCLALPGLFWSKTQLAWIALECGGDGRSPQVFPASPVIAEGRRAYDPETAQLAAVEALAALLGRPDLSVEERETWLRQGALWIAHPVRLEGRYVAPVAHDLLRQVLPDSGAALVGPVTALLLKGEFDNPSEGTGLIASLEESVAVPALRALADPRGTTPEAVVAAAAGALRNIGRLGDAEIAAALLDRSRATDLRTDAVHALRRDPAAIALPLLILAASLADDDVASDTVASDAATVLLARTEPEVRAALEAALLDGRWRRHESDLLRSLVAKATDADWAFLDRALQAGPKDLRDAIFDALRYPKSKLRGPRAVALVHAGQELLRTRPGVRLGIDDGSIARGLCAVAPAEGVAFVKAHWKGPDRDSLTLLRNLQTVKLPEAAEFALEVAAGVSDSNAVTLGIVTTVLGGECPKDVERLDPFWRRCLSAKDEFVVKGALSALERKFARKPLEPLLLKILAGPGRPGSDGAAGTGVAPGGAAPPPRGGALPKPSAQEFSPETRLSALKALLLEPSPNAEPVFWRLVADGGEDDGLRADVAQALVSRASKKTREEALAWLEAPSADDSVALPAVARVAGRGADPATAARLLAMLGAALAKKFPAPPYYRPAAIEDPTDHRIDALCAGIGETTDAPTLDAVAELVFDPRFARWSAEALRAQWIGFPASPGPLSPLVDPAPFPTQLRRPKEPTAEAPMPVPAAPPALQALRDAIVSGGPEAAALRVARAVAGARASGRLAAFPDAYLTALALQLRSGGPSPSDDGLAQRGPRPDFSAAAEAVEAALPFTFPSGSAQEVEASRARTQGHLRAHRFAAAAREQAECTALAARTGLCDLEPGPDSREERLPPWRVLRAMQDALEGAAAAAAGKPEEARDAFARAVRRTAGDAATLANLATLRARVRFDLAGAEADARRALALKTRREDRDVSEYRRALAEVLRAAGKPEEALRVLEGVADDATGD